MNLFDSKSISGDSTFNRLRDNPELDRQRSFINQLFEQFDEYSDNNFVSEFPHHCISRFWEMYLGCALLNSGFKLVPRSILKEGGPDICIKQKDSYVWIEAVAPNNGTDPDLVSFMNRLNTKVATQVPEEQIVLRFCSAIKDKHCQHLQHIRDGLVSPNEPFIIAVNGAGVSHSNTQPGDIPYPIQAVFPSGNYTIVFDPKTRQKLDEGFIYRPKLVKQKGSDVSTDIFRNCNYAFISALLFSNIHPFNCKEINFADFSLLHHHSPLNQLAKGWLHSGWEWWIEEEPNLRLCRINVATS